MEAHELAKSYLDLKTKRDEKRRIIDYVHAKKLKDLEQQATDVDSRLRVLSFKNDIKNDEDLYEQYDSELREIAEELKPILGEIKAHKLEPLKTQLNDKIYVDTWLDEDGNVQNSGTYHKMN